MTYSVFFWSELLFLFLVGMVLYSLDHRFGVAARRAFVRLTTEPGTDPPIETGFIYGQRVKARVVAATAVAAVQTVLTLVFGSYNPLLVLLTVAAAVPVLVAGFYAGPLLDRIIGRTDALLDQAERLEVRIEQGNTTLGHEAVNAARTVGSRARDTLRESFSRPARPPTADPSSNADPPPTPSASPSPTTSAADKPDPDESPAPTTPAADKPDPDEPDPDEALRRFTGKDRA